MLYLDKCWRELQVLLGNPDGGELRPAFELVRGDVTHHSEGWVPFIRALEPRQVAAVATDLASVTEAEVTAMVTSWVARSGESAVEEQSYALQYLGDAKAFTARLAGDGRGLVYEIR